MNLVGRSGAAGGLVTGAQFYKALRKDTRAEARKLDERYMKEGCGAASFGNWNAAGTR